MTDTTQSNTSQPDVEPQGDVPADGTAAEPKSRDRRSVAERLEREGEIAADYLETLLDVADLDGDLDVDVDGDRAAVSIVDSEEGRVPRRLIGRDGEVLEALQELARLAVLAQTGERSRLMLDVGGHRSARREALVARAREAVEQVRSSGDRLALEPMSPFERKVVHDAVAALGFATESEGVEPQRHVVVLPA
jgi:spoIIIJ-associated protein